jgi:DNA-directed RNA polymerase subunit RPC12/RpoP
MTTNMIRCEYCQSDQVFPFGTSHAMQNFVGNMTIFKGGLLGGVVGQTMDLKGYDPLIHEQIGYKCKSCKKKFFIHQKADALKHDFEIPCTITFIREKKVLGALVDQLVYLNGFKIGPVKNGQAIQFFTYKINNVVVVTDVNGLSACADYFAFEAFEGGSQNIRFGMGFLDKRGS